MRSRRTTSNVKGPNSALTEFLRLEGITDAFRRRREAEGTTTQPPEEPSVSAATPPPSGHRQRRQTKRRRDLDLDPDEEFIPEHDDDDDDDADADVYYDDDDVQGVKISGEEDTCVECGTTFYLNVYLRYLQLKKGYLCDMCNEVLKRQERAKKRNQVSARRKRKTVALALLNKRQVLLPKLQDICIHEISNNINDVDVLGNIGETNLNKISQILSKNRSLNNKTIGLFLGPHCKALEFWDCSNVDSDSLNKIGSFCPYVESLTLHMCGQLHNDNMKYFSTNLPHLKHLSLDGPFLISDSMWQEFFETEVGKNLVSFEVRNTHRFGNDSLIGLLENCGSKLTLLKLSRLDTVDSGDVWSLLPHYLGESTLTELEISYPVREELITDDLIINILSVTGDTLEYLNLTGCSNLTDKLLSDGITKFCPLLRVLILDSLDQLTDEGFANAMGSYSTINQGGLTKVLLSNCVGLGDNALYALFQHSGSTLIELNTNSIHNLSKESLLQMFTDDLHPSKVEQQQQQEQNSISYFPQVHLLLLTTWDIGFVRSVDDEVVKAISDHCTKLQILEVYGNNRCSSRVLVREGLLLLGRQSDSI
ncbi:uncharacterized protein KQ657_002780 [Scheffersomyces spartinae]|uniref:DNA repair protein rhp7 treble clef domain-containing protein n=1 Tax=Scheffersomyces spartinae TaxID=45513 RepID=A0A9P8AGU9_9ASCO|nr:uncharacterized protein KQ657_002780 [Scheffersomyces spartinae]KAG7191815.1 hypothetical protein KQ657_002780 [Scheffersomyces spartinae]